MNRSCISLVGVVAATGFLFAAGADAGTLPRPIDSVKIASNAIQTRLDSSTTDDEWVPAVGQSWNYNLMVPVDTSVNADVVMIDMGELDKLPLDTCNGRSCQLVSTKGWLPLFLSFTGCVVKTLV